MLLYRNEQQDLATDNVGNEGETEVKDKAKTVEGDVNTVRVQGEEGLGRRGKEFSLGHIEFLEPVALPSRHQTSSWKCGTE